METKELEFNLNDTATVVLTEEGAEHLNIRDQEFINISKVYGNTFTEDELKRYCNHKEGDVYSIELWKLMNNFGDVMDWMYPQSFEKNIVRITKEDDWEISDETIMKVLNAIGYEEQSWIPVVREKLKKLN